MPIKKQKKYRLIIEFETLAALKMHIIQTGGLYFGDINARPIDSLDTQKQHSRFETFIVRRHSEIPAELRLFHDPV